MFGLKLQQKAELKLHQHYVKYSKYSTSDLFLIESTNVLEVYRKAAIPILETNHLIPKILQIKQMLMRTQKQPPGTALCQSPPSYSLRAGRRWTRLLAPCPSLPFSPKWTGFFSSLHICPLHQPPPYLLLPALGSTAGRLTAG